MSAPNYIMSQLTQAAPQLAQKYNSYKSQLLPNSAVYGIIGRFSEQNEFTKHDVYPMTGLSDKEIPEFFQVSSGSIATAIYNNSTKTEMFSMVLNSVLGVNDALFIIQYNDASPDLDQLLFVKNQEMILSEEVKINLKPNDCIIVAFGKIQQDGKPLKVGITTIGKNVQQQMDMIGGNPYAVHHTQSVSGARKGVFVGLMIVLAIAIGVFIYNITNPPKAGFRRRR